VLENLVLKQNALEELNIPVQTVYGHLGKFDSGFTKVKQDLPSLTHII
jgi:hypothetical protein